jgi:hypothetical membrane protein
MMSRRGLMAGLSGAASPIVGIGLMLAAAATSREFSWEGNALSDLGVAEPETALIFNSSVIIAGALFLVFLSGVSDWAVGDNRGRAGLACLLAGGISLMLVGVFTEQYGLIHTAVSAGYFILLPAGLILVGLSGSPGLPSRSLRILSLFLGPIAVVALLATLPLLCCLGLEAGFAVPELLESLILSSWVVAVAVRLIKSGRETHS